MTNPGTSPTIKAVLATGEPGQRVTLQGWVRTKRAQKTFTFINLNDGSTLAGLQVVIDSQLGDYEALMKRVTTGAAIAVTGVLVASPAQGQRLELQGETLTVVGEADDSYPLQKKRHSFEFLRTLGHLRPRTNTLGAVFRVRNACAQAIHQFFRERDFLWVHTPILTGSDCEGAGELFTVTSLDLSQPGATPDFSQDFFGQRAYLTVSGQLEAEIMAMAFRNVYTFGPTFRAENSNTSRHLAEFWMVEPEMAFCTLQGNQDLAEDFLHFIFRYGLEHCQEDLTFFNDRIDNSVLATAQTLADSEFGRITYTEAIALLEKAPQPFEYPVAWGIDLQSEHERYLAEQVFQKPVIVTDYPAGIKAFYMRLNDDGRTVAAMDVLAPKVGELIGGSQREERLAVLQSRIEGAGLPLEAYWWYLDLRRYGTVPHAGFGLGFERLVQFMTGMGNIRDVIPFPRTPENIEF